MVRRCRRVLFRKCLALNRVRWLSAMQLLQSKLFFRMISRDPVIRLGAVAVTGRTRAEKFVVCRVCLALML